MVDLEITNGRVVTPGGVLYGGITIEGGKIVAVGNNRTFPKAYRTIDAQGNFVIPGLIDPHVHLGSEEDTTLEEGINQNFPVETEGALHGGVTTAGHFVGARGKSLIANLEKTIRYGEQNSFIDFFCHAIIMDEKHLPEQAELCRLGVTSFKHMFNAYKPAKDDQRMSWLSGPVDPGTLFKSFEFCARKGYPAIGMVHCEDMDICVILEERIKAAGRKDLAAWTESHPNYAEYIKIMEAIEIAKITGASLYVVHVSTAEGVELIGRARKQGYRIWGETAPHYLTHTAGMEDEVGCWGKVNPALKYDRDRERLWRGILDGAISCLGTDHGTGGRTMVKKEGGQTKHGNIWSSRVGIRGGMEHLLPVLMTEGVHTGKISMEDLVRLCSTQPAKVFGLYPKKGVIAPGADADLVLVDPDKEAVIDRFFYHCICEVSIYQGRRVKGMARTTIVGGQVMMEDYQTTGKYGKGKYIPCRRY